MKRLLLILSVFAFSESIFASGNLNLDFGHTAAHIWSDSTGTSWLWNWNVKSDFKLKELKAGASVDFDYGDSTLNLFSGKISVLDAKASVQYKRAGAELEGGFLNTKKIALHFDNHEYSNDSLSAGFFGAAFPLYLGLKIKPFFYFTKTSSEKGDFYWFYGHPEVDFAFLAGNTFSFKNHFLTLSYGNLNLDVLSNENAELVNADAFAVSAFYSQKWQFFSRKLIFEPFGLYVYAKGDFSGELNAQNQGYVLFPYKYYKVSGNLDFNLAAFGGKSSFYCGKNIFQIDSGIFCFVTQNFDYSVDAKYKQYLLWGGETVYKNHKNSQLAQKGVVLLNFNYQRNIPVAENQLVLGISKLFEIPFSLKKSTAGSGSGTSESSSNSDLIFSYLFSGCTVSINFKL